LKAFITGASSGIGRDMARVLANKGYDLILVARGEEKLRELAEDLKRKYSINIEIVSIDLSSIENVKTLEAKLKNVDILINNAGFGDCGNFQETSLNKEINMINTNIVAYHILMKLYLKMGKENGKILNVASIAGFMPGPLMATYYATKAYIVKISESIREELRKEKSKVQISILCPGPVKTNFKEVAHVKFYMREVNSMKVAQYAIQRMEKGKFYIVPGFDVKLAKLGAKLLPNSFISKITYRIQKSYK